MGFKDIIQKMGAKNKEKKEHFKQLQEQDQLSTMVEERKKSANQRELERYIKENKEKEIKEYLEVARRKRYEDIAFQHNPLNTKNIMKSQWSVLKEKNQFANKENIFQNQEFIHKNNNSLLNNGNILKGRNILVSGGYSGI